MTLHKASTVLIHSLFQIVQKEKIAVEIATKIARVNWPLQILEPCMGRDTIRVGSNTSNHS